MDLVDDLRDLMLRDAIERHGMRAEMRDWSVPDYIRVPMMKPVPRAEVEVPDFARRPGLRPWLLACLTCSKEAIRCVRIDEDIPIASRIPTVEMRRSDWVNPSRDGSVNDLYAIFAGQCRDCSTIHWAIVGVGRVVKRMA